MMPQREIHAITGAFGYSGKYIARRLLNAGYEVRTLTNTLHHPKPFGDCVRAYPLNFDQPEKLVEALRGVAVFYNTYWVRFNYRTFTHSEAVENTLKLFRAAKEAGVPRIVHVSITNASADSPLEYFRGKGQLERALIDSGLSYAILRPAVLFGKEDVLVNNIAWTLRTLPVFGVFGDGSYRLQPIYVDDLAKIAVEQGGKSENVTINTIGPETFTFRDLVKQIGAIIGKPRPVISMPPRLAHSAASLIGRIMGDVMLTWEEVRGLMADLLYVDAVPAGATRLTEWTRVHADTLGVRYANELARRRT